ncbi:CvpA family protein [Thermodesulfatator atlanticus]|uniref:CvpA family protein n=1 Tax=Thermodesulfatator atlanticus TaxID=501497 RepID=UPI0003B4BDCE|nr:CvpA family protein [Thermodesulfatator atlanticus]
MNLPNLPFNTIDVIVILVLALFILRGAWIGFFRGISSFAGLVAGYITAVRYHLLVENIIAPWLQAPWISASWLKAASFAVAFLLGYLAVFIVAEIIAYFFKKARLTWMDRLLGAGLGAFKGFLLLVAVFFLITTFFPQGEKIFRGSKTYPYIMQGARHLAEFMPSEIKARFNYNLRRILYYERNH